MFTTLCIIFAVVLFAGLTMVLIDVKNIVSEIGTGLFVFGLCAFIFFLVFGKLYSIPMITTTNYYAINNDLELMAQEHDAKVVLVNRDERIVHKYSKKDNVDEWIYYKFDPELFKGTTLESQITESTEETEQKVESGYG